VGLHAFRKAQQLVQLTAAAMACAASIASAPVSLDTLAPAVHCENARVVSLGLPKADPQAILEYRLRTGKFSVVVAGLATAVLELANAKAGSQDHLARSVSCLLCIELFVL